MRKKIVRVWLFIAAILLISSGAIAQTPTAEPTPPDVDLRKIGGIYRVGCQTQSDTDLNQACWARVDLPDGIVELGCLDAPDPNTAYHTEISVTQTPFVDAIIKCYVNDLDGLVSEYSANSGLIDFTPPGRPFMVSKLVTLDSWPQSRQRKASDITFFDEPEEILWTPRTQTLVLSAAD